MSQFYDAADGSNLQPAFQKAIDHAAASGLPKVVNDWSGTPGRDTCEMWCPVRTNGPGLQSDGIPLVVRSPVELDFRGLHIDLRGPDGGPRWPGQSVVGHSEPWLGGWLYVIGNAGFERFTLRNVSVDGHFDGDWYTNQARNLSDKGFRIQDSDVSEVFLENVELRNFGGEIYYIGGTGVEYQDLTDCHFHGSPQCAFNAGGAKPLKATNLQAGRAYQCAEVIGGLGNEYHGGRFYDSGHAGSSFLGGPSPEFLPGHPWWFSHWDGNGEPPWITFDQTRFDNVKSVNLGSWIRGSIVTTDSPVENLSGVGHNRSIDLDIRAIVDKRNDLYALGVHGIEEGLNRVPHTPDGTYYDPPSDFAARIHCERSPSAIASGLNFRAGIWFYGTRIDAPSFRLALSGHAQNAYEMVHQNPAFIRPVIDTSGFMGPG